MQPSKTSGIDALPFVAKFGEPSLRAVKPISRSRLWLALRSFSEAIPLGGASRPTTSIQVAGSNAQIPVIRPRAWRTGQIDQSRPQRSAL
jgi:hypothetical protein